MTHEIISVAIAAAVAGENKKDLFKLFEEDVANVHVLIDCINESFMQGDDLATETLVDLLKEFFIRKSVDRKLQAMGIQLGDPDTDR